MTRSPLCIKGSIEMPLIVTYEAWPPIWGGAKKYQATASVMTPMKERVSLKGLAIARDFFRSYSLFGRRGGGVDPAPSLADTCDPRTTRGAYSCAYTSRLTIVCASTP